ncbi:MAG: hypothetical protein RLZZ200_675 [Pseudomonadota bacterium]|jgi:methionyl-tRNA formyltransferase
MRVVLIGAVEFSRAALERLLALGTQVVGVCTLAESAFNSDHVDLAALCRTANLPCFHADRADAGEMAAWIRDAAPDVILCLGWSRLLGKDILDIAPLGVIGFHPAALPRNRGRHPLVWALVLGLDATASTFFFMDASADGGDLLDQRPVPIDPQDDARTLYDKVTQTALEQLTTFLPMLAAGTYPRVPQDLSRATSWRRRGRRDGQIDWRMSARSIHNLVRGLTRPYVGAHFVAADGRDIKVWKSAVVDGVPLDLEPGKVLALDSNGPIIKCGEAAICLLETEPSFKPNVGDYL